MACVLAIFRQCYNKRTHLECYCVFNNNALVTDSLIHFQRDIRSCLCPLAKHYR